jgi:hypothetical protein
MPTLVDAFAASALDWLGWLLGVVLRLGAARGSRRLKRCVESLERDVEAIIFLKAALRVGAPIRTRRSARPLNAPFGFRRLCAHRRRLLFKHARICDRRTGLYERVLRAISALARPERYIARFAARLRRGLCASILIPIAPPAHALRSAPQPAIAGYDTS